MSKTSGPALKTTDRGRRSVRLFISYSHRDYVWMDRLVPLLDGFQSDDRVGNRGIQYLRAWHDNELTAGNQWDGQIKRELEKMDIFVPLVSTNFFASWYIQKVELSCAKKRHKRGEILVLPILLHKMNLREKCKFLHSFSLAPSSSRPWASFANRSQAHWLIDAALWKAIDEAL